MYNKLMKQEEIMNLLNNTKIILNNETIDYLQSIINLEISVVKDIISDEQRKALTELQVYRSALIYNIYNRDVVYFDNEFKQTQFKFFDFYINSNDVPTIKFSLNTSNIELIQKYFEKLKQEYDLKENALIATKKFVKKVPGLLIKKD